VVAQEGASALTACLTAVVQHGAVEVVSGAIRADTSSASDKPSNPARS
jgi:hypothetical protein